MLADLFRRAVLSASDPSLVVASTGGGGPPTVERSRKLSAVFAAVEIRSNTMSVLPAYMLDTTTRERVQHPILELLNARPNEAMTPAVRKKLLEESILLTGNAYDWIIRDPVSALPKELIPIPGNLVTVWMDDKLRPWYDVSHPVTGAIMRLPAEDICHYKGPSRNGFMGQSILSYAADTIQAGLAAQEYNRSYYENGGYPSGVLYTESDLGGYVQDATGRNTDVTKKEALRRSWEKVHSGPQNGHRVAILDLGLKYTPLSVSNRDSQFVEQQDITVQDIARFFSVPLYKLQSGKQSYNANEQNSIEYVQQAIQPRTTAIEEEQTWRLLMQSERKNGLEIRYNLMAILRGDSQSRAKYYETMWRIGAYSDNMILQLEDMPDIEGGDEHMASLNYVPLSLWKQLSINRNGGKDGGKAKSER